MHCRKSVLFKNFIPESSAIKYALTNAAWICHCWKNGRYFYIAHLVTLRASERYLVLVFSFNLNQWCSGVGTRGKGVPTPLFWHYISAYATTQMAIFWFKNFLDCRLSSESFEPLSALLAYLEPKLWLKKQKLGKILGPQTLTSGIFVVVVRMIKLQDRFLLTRCTEPVGV